MGPYGAAFLYVAPHRQEGRPLEFNWINRARSEDFAGLVQYTDAFQPGARRFDVGQQSNGVDPEALAKALERDRIYVSVRGSSVRISPHLYNSPADVDRLLDCVHGALKVSDHQRLGSSPRRSQADQRPMSLCRSISGA